MADREGKSAIHGTVDMTQGNALKHVFSFMLPILLSNAFQQLYSTVDTVVVGHVLGDAALAAVGSCSQLSNFFMSFAIGMCSGFSLVISACVGSGDEGKLKRAVGGTVLLALLAGGMITALCLPLLYPLMHMISIPDELLEMSADYLSVVMGAVLVTVAYNMLCSMLRGIGNSVIPLLCLVVSSAVNIVLDLVFVNVLGYGIAGAAWATVIAQAVSVLLCLVYILRKCPVLRLSAENFRLTGAILRELLSCGTNVALISTTVNIGTIIMQAGVNGMGTQTIAAHTAGRKISIIFFLPNGALSTALGTFAGQNIGAGKKERIYRCTGQCLLGCLGYAAVVNAIVFLFGRSLVAAITGSTDEYVISTAVRYLHLVMPFVPCLLATVTLRMVLQAMGVRREPLVTSIFEMVSKIVAVFVMIDRIGYTGIILAEPVAWVFGTVLLGIRILLEYRRYRAELQ